MDTPKAMLSISNSINKENDGPAAASAVVKDGHFFLKEVETEKFKIEKRISAGVEKLESMDEASDEAGKALAAIGKAKLLINKKFKQFEGLCQTNIKEKTQGTSGEPFSTQNEDLAGFWDLVLIQVDQIHQMFKELDCSCAPKNLTTAGANGETPLRQRSALAPKKDASKKIGSPKKTTLVRVVKPSPASTPNVRDEMRRQLITERRKAMKNSGDVMRGAASDANIQIFTP